MDFQIPEGEGMGRFVVEWININNENKLEVYDYYHDALSQYYHLKKFDIKVSLVIRALPLPFNLDKGCE